MGNESSQSAYSILSLLKDTFLKNKWYILIYIVIIGLFVCAQHFMYHRASTFNREFILYTILLVMGIFIISYHSRNPNKLHRTAFFIIILFGLITLIMAPILVGCDEDEHLARGELMSRGVIVPQYELQPNGKIGYHSIGSVLNLDGKTRFHTVFSTTVDDQPINNSRAVVGAAFSQNPFYPYLAQGLGIATAKFLNLNMIWILWLGGLFNLILYAGVSSFAIKKTPILKVPMIAVACLPFAVYEAVTVSSDAFVNGFALLFFAYFFYMYKSPDDSLDWKNLGIFFTICLSLGLIKPPLFFLACLVLLVPRTKYTNKKYFKWAILGIVLLFLIAVLWNVFYAMPQLHKSHRGLRAKVLNIDAIEQVKFMLFNPSTSLAVMWDILTKTSFVITDMFRFADWQGSQSYAASLMAYVFAPLYGVLTFFYPIKYKLSNKKRLIGAIIFIIPYLAFFLVQYLTWTPIGALRIQGVQGRYYISLLILLPFILNLNSENTRIGRKIQEKFGGNYITQFNNVSITIVMALLACLQVLTLVFYY